MQRVLDLGCGGGDSYRKLGLSVDHFQIIGFDVARERVRDAHAKYSNKGWHYACARGERLPLPDGSIEGVFANVALPYMHIPDALAEIHRVLVSGGWLHATLHPPAFTLRELKNTFPKPRQSFYRALVLLNGVVLHFSGNVFSVGNVAESCQTETGMRRVLKRSGFVDVSFQNVDNRFLIRGRRATVNVSVPPLARAS